MWGALSVIARVPGGAVCLQPEHHESSQTADSDVHVQRAGAGCHERGWRRGCSAPHGGAAPDVFRARGHARAGAFMGQLR